MATFETQFGSFSKFGDSKSDGKSLTLSKSDKWMKQAKVFDKKITTTDTAICFNKLKQKALSMEDYNTFLEDLAKSKGIESKVIKDKMASCGPPGFTNATEVAVSDAVRRLTDTSQYTGIHKERFDKDGRGRGKEGRTDSVTNDGYVQGFKQKKSQDKGKTSTSH